MGANVNNRVSSVVLKRLIPELHENNEPSFYPLHLAAYFNNIEATQILLKSNSVLNSTTACGVMPVEFAACKLNRRVLQIMVVEKHMQIDVDELASVVDEMMEIGSRIKFAGRSAIWTVCDMATLASYFGKTVLLKWILHNSRSAHYSTFALSPLHGAVLGGHIECIRLLLQLGETEETTISFCVHGEGLQGMSPLLLAAHYGKLEILKLLNANLDQATTQLDSRLPRDVRTPLDMAAMAGHKDVIEFLLHQKGHLTYVAGELFKLGLRAKADGAPTLLAMALKEKHIMLAHLLLDFSSPNISPVSLWMTKLQPKLSPDPYESPIHDKQELYNFANILQRSNFKQFLDSISHLPECPKPVYGTPGHALLALACSTGDLGLIERFVPTNATTDNSTQLQQGINVAATLNHEQVVLKLLQNPLVINQQQALNQALLHACLGGHVQLAKTLISMGASGDKDISPLQPACLGGHTETVKMLLDMGLDINTRFQYHIPESLKTPLKLASRGGHIELVIELLKRDAAIEGPKTDRFGIISVAAFTPLHKALEWGHGDVALELIKAGAYLRLPAEPSDITTLHFAVTTGAIEVVRICLQRDTYNPLVVQHMLSLAAFYGRLNVVQELMTNVSITGGTEDPFLFAVAGGNADIALLMLQHGAIVNKVTKPVPVSMRGKYYLEDVPFHSPVLKNNVEMVKLLLDHGVDVDFKDSKNKTPLMHASSIVVPHGVLDVVKLLVERGAKMDYACNSGSVLGNAVATQNMDLITYLKAHAPHASIYSFPNALIFEQYVKLFGIPKEYIATYCEQYFSQQPNLLRGTLNSTLVQQIRVMLKYGAVLSALDLRTALRQLGADLIPALIGRNNPISNGSHKQLLIGKFQRREQLANLLHGLELEITNFPLNAQPINGFYEKAQSIVEREYWLLTFKSHQELRAAKMVVKDQCDVILELTLNLHHAS